MQATRQSYMYDPQYSDKYLVHLNELSKDTSNYNLENAKSARLSLDGLEKIRNKNRKITEELVQNSNAPSIFGLIL